MNAYLLTNHPDRFERLESELLHGGHHVVVLPILAEWRHLATSAPHPGPPPDAPPLPIGIDLAICDSSEGEDLVARWRDLCDSPGRPSIAVAFLEVRDLVRAQAALDAGFDDVLYGDCEPDGATIRRWEKSLARLNGQRMAQEVLDRTREYRLRESEQRFRDLANNMTQMAWMSDEKGSVFWYNQRWYDYTGTRLEEMQGQGWSTVFHPDHVEQVIAKFGDLLQRGAPGEEMLPIRGVDGRYRWFLTRVVPIRDEAGRIVRWLGTNTDVTEQKEASERIEQSRAQLAAVLDSVQDGIIVVDMQGRLVFANQAQARIAGLASADDLERRLMEYARIFEFLELDGTLVPPDHWPLMRILHGEILTEWRLRGRDRDSGKEWIFSITGQPVRDERGDPVLAVLVTHDDTAQHTAEDAVLRERELLSRLIDRLPVMITLLNTRTGAFRFNEEFHRILGWTDEDASREDIFALAITDPKIREQGRKYFLTCPPGWHEFTILSKEGAPVLSSWAYLATEDMRVAIGIDLRERKQVEAALRESEEKLRAMAESLPQIVWTAEPDGTVDYCNRRWSEYTGNPSERGHGSGWAAIIHPDDAPKTTEAWTGALRYNSVYVCEHRLRRHDGAFRWFLSRSVPLKDGEGRVVKWFGTATDIDDQKRAQDQLSRSRDELEVRVRERTAELEAQANELERSNAELQRFAYLASHDLQEPLRIVVSYAQLLAKRYGECAGQEAEEFIGYMTSAARRMGELIDDLLAYSRLESAAPRLQRVEMADCVREALARRHDGIRSSGAEVAVGPLPAIEADEVLLGRLLDQLLGNALKFRGDAPPRIAISATQEEGRWIFSVRDNGIGIPREFQAAVFEPFRRLHHWDEYPGTGIGLAVCRRIVESHGGRIWVESAEGGGSVFRFTIPVATAGAAGEQTETPDPVHEEAH